MVESLHAMIIDWNAVSAIGTAFAAAFAAYSSWLSRSQVKAAKEAAEISSDAIQIQVFNDIFKDIQQQGKHIECSAGLSPEEQAFQDRMFFNTVNYLAFLIEDKVLRKPAFIDYYRDAFIHWDKLFEIRVPLDDRNDPRKYPELKRMIAGLKNPIPSFPLLNE